MKLRNIFTMLAAALAFAFVGCQEEERFLDEVQVSQSFVAIPVAGGDVKVTVNAAGDWEITDIPEWLTVTPAAGNGKTEVTFHAGEASATNEAIVSLNCAGATQLITVLQLAEKVELPISTCKEVINGVDGVVYRVKGTVTSIANTQYGNWYLEDETGSVYVYGTLYEGAEKQFEKLGIEVGDVVTCEGPRKDYSGTIELVNVTVIDIEKSLIQLDSAEVLIAQPAGEFALNVVSKKGGLNAKPDCDWITVTGLEVKGENCVVNLSYTPNNHLVSRTGVVQLSIGDAKSAVSFVQEPRAMVDADIVDGKTIADFLAAEVSTDVYYRLTAKVTKIDDATYGNIYVKDETGKELYVYGLTEKKLAPGSKNDKSFEKIGLKPGDIVTFVGTRAAYKDNPQMAGPCWYESHVASKAVSVKDFLAAAVDETTLYELTGVITEINNTKYGNLYLEDKEGESVYVYGLTEFPLEKGEKNDESFAELKLLVGDTLTVRGFRGEYKGSPQMVNGYYATHSAPARVTYKYKKATAVTSGKTYAIVANDGKALQAAMPLAESLNYGYLNPAQVTAEGDVLTTTVANEFVFTAVEGGYTIAQPDGRLLYMSGTFNSFNVKKDATEGHVWTVAVAADGTATITNVAMNKYVQYSTQYKSYGAYSSAQEEAAMPVLYEKVTE